MSNEVNSAELCLNAVNALEDQLRGARKTLLNSETCVVNRSILTAQLEYLRDNLPQTVEMAAKIVAEEQTQNMVNDAAQKARQMAEQAAREANSLLDRANQDAAAGIEAAKAEAARIVEDAEKKARELVEEENIVRRARVESEELRENAKADAANLHKNTLDYIDSLLAETDRKLSELINNIRLERNEIRNHR